jgi:hypothetical protein
MCTAYYSAYYRQYHRQIHLQVSNEVRQGFRLAYHMQALYCLNTATTKEIDGLEFERQGRKEYLSLKAKPLPITSRTKHSRPAQYTLVETGTH